MKRKLLLATLLLGIAGAAIASALADLSGKWTGKITTPDGNDLQIYYEFKVDGNKLTGTATGDGSPTAIDSGVMKGNDFTFSVSNPQGTVFKHIGKYYPQGDSVGVDISFGANKMHAKLSRQ